MMIYMILITKLADLLMLDAIFLQSVAFTFSFDHARNNGEKTLELIVIKSPAPKN